MRFWGTRCSPSFTSIRKAMAFWGVEVKPGKPFAHKYDGLKGRVHISMATLGFGAATAKSILQCHVGDRSPVYLCSLSSGATESLQLNLEFEEVDEVIFSVIGPRSIHLCGYYLGSGRNANIEESMKRESYGEDIANTETERSDNSDEDDYENSFIDDDADLEVYPPSPIYIEAIEDASRDKKLKGSRRRLRRKYQRIESDDDKSFEGNTQVNSNKHDQTEAIDDEDNLPISSLCKSKATTGGLFQEMDVSDERKEGDASNKDGEDGGNSNIKLDLKADDVPVDSQDHRGTEPVDNLIEHCALLADGNVQKLKTKKKEKEEKREDEHTEAKDACNGQSINLSTVMEPEPKMDNMVRDLRKGNEQSHGQAYDKDVELPGNVALPASEIDPESRGTKRKRKEQVPNGSCCEGDNAHCEEFKASRDEAESDNVILRFPEEKYQNQKQNDEERGDNVTHDFPNVNQSEDRNVKRRKKKNKSQAINSDMPQSSLEQNIGTLKEDEISKADAKPSQVRTLSNGLVVQELESGKEDGKIAASGRKISVLYTGKLKDNGEVFESNVGHAPYKFRLGKGKVLDGWDVGLEGMRVGEKRRLLIPPSMGFGSEGHGDKIPPNSWLVYDFELVKVH